MNFVILSSSRGTTMQAVLDRIADGSLTAKCKGLISDREERGCIQKAKDVGLPYLVVKKEKGESREEYDVKLNNAINKLIEDDENTYIACMGWMFIFSPWFINRWKNKIINVHPALLPKYGGKGMYGMHVHKAVLSSGEKESGVSIHLMDEGVDTGPVIKQKKCKIEDEETEESLKAKVQELEKEEYPKVLQEIEEGNI